MDLRSLRSMVDEEPVLEPAVGVEEEEQVCIVYLNNACKFVLA